MLMKGTTERDDLVVLLNDAKLERKLLELQSIVE